MKNVPLTRADKFLLEGLPPDSSIHRFDDGTTYGKILVMPGGDTRPFFMRAVRTEDGDMSSHIEPINHDDIEKIVVNPDGTIDVSRFL